MHGGDGSTVVPDDLCSFFNWWFPMLLQSELHLEISGSSVCHPAGLVTEWLAPGSLTAVSISRSAAADMCHVLLVKVCSILSTSCVVSFLTRCSTTACKPLPKYSDSPSQLQSRMLCLQDFLFLFFPLFSESAFLRNTEAIWLHEIMKIGQNSKDFFFQACMYYALSLSE